MKKLLTSVCAIAIGAAVGMTADLKQAVASPLSIGLMYPAATQAEPSYSRADLISTYSTPIQEGGTSGSIALKAPTGAQIALVAVMRNYTVVPPLTSEPVPTLNGAAMLLVAESERSQMAWAKVVSGLNYTFGWGSSVTMLGSVLHVWWFKNVSTICPVIGGRRDARPSSGTSGDYTCFTGPISTTATYFQTRFYNPASPLPFICAVTSVESRTNEGTWQAFNLTNVKKYFSSKVLTAAVALNDSLGTTEAGTIGFRLANTLAENFQEMCLCEVVGLTTGYPEFYAGPRLYDSSTVGSTKTFSGVEFGSVPTSGKKRLIVIAGQTVGREVPLTGVTIGGVTAKIRLITTSASFWRKKGAWTAWAEVPTGTTGSIVCTYGGDGGESFLQLYIFYNTKSLTEVFGESLVNPGDFTSQSKPWQFMVVSAVAEDIGMIFLNGDIGGCIHYASGTKSTATDSGYVAPQSGLVSTKESNGVFTVSLEKRSGAPITGVMSVFG